MVQKNSRTYLLVPVVFTPNVHDFQVWRLARESWKFAVIHWPWHAGLTTLSCRTKLSAPPDIRPDASRLRMLFIMSSCADGDRSETSPPQTLQQRRAWLMTFHCFSKSTVFFDSPSRKKASCDWRVTQTATVLVVRSLARRFCFSCWGHGVTTEWNIYTKTSFKRRKSRSARQHFESSNLSVSQVLVPPSMSMFFDMSIARPSYRNASPFPWKTDAILAFSQAALRRTFEPP